MASSLEHDNDNNTDNHHIKWPATGSYLFILSRMPSAEPSIHPSMEPLSQPSVLPTINQSVQPSVRPSVEPSVQPSLIPSAVPSSAPLVEPSVQPSTIPSIQPSIQPSLQPSLQPSVQPSSTHSSLPSISSAPSMVEPCSRTNPFVFGITYNTSTMTVLSNTNNHVNGNDFDNGNIGDEYGWIINYNYEVKTDMDIANSIGATLIDQTKVIEETLLGLLSDGVTVVVGRSFLHCSCKIDLLFLDSHCSSFSSYHHIFGTSVYFLEVGGGGTGSNNNQLPHVHSTFITAFVMCQKVFFHFCITLEPATFAIAKYEKKTKNAFLRLDYSFPFMAKKLLVKNTKNLILVKTSFCA